MVDEHPFDLGFDHARIRERWNFIFTKKIHSISFRAKFCFTADEFVSDEHFIDVKGERGLVWMFGAIEYGQNFLRVDGIAGFLPDFAFNAFGRRLPDVRPTARQRPAPVGFLADEQKFAVAEDYAANIYFGRGIAGVILQQAMDFSRRQTASVGKHLGGDLADLVVTLDIVRILGKSEPVLGDGLKLLAPIEPARVIG